MSIGRQPRDTAADLAAVERGWRYGQLEIRLSPEDEAEAFDDECVRFGFLLYQEKRKAEAERAAP